MEPYNWLVCGIIPDKNFPLSSDNWFLTHEAGQTLTLRSTQGYTLPVQRGTTSLIASTLVALHKAHIKNDENTPRLNPLPASLPCLLVGDTGDGSGSHELYDALATNILAQQPWDGITFHYLFPHVDGHERVLMACESLSQKPLLVADAGFMYVAKMSGYADFYDVFTPDVGEMAFLADEQAPHPFYTRGFLLARETDIPDLLTRAKTHKNIPKHMIIKGKSDYIVTAGDIVACIDEPCVPAMEAIGGTGDLVTGFVTAALIAQKRMHNINIPQALQEAAQQARQVAQSAQPSPATQVEAILCHALSMHE